jgi:transcriptional regulator with XRE-family HTH domain
VGKKPMDITGQMPLLSDITEPPKDLSTLAAVAAAFDPARLTQARRLEGLTKKSVAKELGVSSVAVGQWESGVHPPRPDHIGRLAEILKVTPAFFAAGRPYARLESSAAHFRSLRRTPAHQRTKAIAFAEQVWELIYALEKRVQLPPVDLPGFTAGEVSSELLAGGPIHAAQSVRQAWRLGNAPIPHMVRLLEAHGLIVTLVPFAGAVRRGCHGHRRRVLDLAAAASCSGTYARSSQRRIPASVYGCP